jgi:ferrochelatase
VRKNDLVVLVQLGSPKSPSIKDVRDFLRKFLSDPKVVDLNPILWKIILELFVLPFRPKRSAKAYARIWDGESFPLITGTEDLRHSLAGVMERDGIQLRVGYLLGNNLVEQSLADLEKFDCLTVVPLFPQFSESTTGSVWDRISSILDKKVALSDIRFISSFHKTKAFIDASVSIIKKAAANKCPGDVLVISFHGIPLRRILEKGDPYLFHCSETFYLMKQELLSIFEEKDIHMTFQSRFGSERWLGPYTDKYCRDLAATGHKNIYVYCPSFVVDCLETIDEIGFELAEFVKEDGAQIHLIPCLNSDEKFSTEFGEYLVSRLEGDGDPQNLEYQPLESEVTKIMPKQKVESPPLSENAKSSLKLIFFVLFLDLVGFSIIFPMFPAMAKYYLEVDAGNPFLKMIFEGITTLIQSGGGQVQPVVLFGGVLGAMYSFLQFLAAPFWGRLSDRIGRRPVLLVSVMGLALSYLLWFFSGSFTLLCIARIMGGIMGGNISTATAVVADVTSSSNRSKGMAFIGIAFALGFIIGPAMGGILSMIDLTKSFPQLASYGVNPFSTPALLSFILSLASFSLLYKKFKETRPTNDQEIHKSKRSSNPLTLFKPLPYAGVNQTNIAHFLFLLAFSGMEFTLTFLAVERLSYTSLDNAGMFIFIGFVLAFVQGGVVRRKAHQVGEKKMALMGLVCLIPGLLSISFAHTTFPLFLGLFFLAVGSAMTIPCLTSLVSLYTPGKYQGEAIGVFRSLGALARVFGPLLACLLYWRGGSGAPYIVGAIFLIIPIIMVFKLPKMPKGESA